MTYYKVSAGFKVVRYADTLAKGEILFKELVANGYNYVELAVVHDGKTYTSQSIKIHC